MNSNQKDKDEQRRKRLLYLNFFFSIFSSTITLISLFAAYKTLPTTGGNLIEITFAVLASILGISIMILKIVRDKRKKLIIRKKYPKLSIIGIMEQKREGEITTAILVLLATYMVYILLARILQLTTSLSIMIIIPILILIIGSGYFAFIYRVRQGFYGNNEYEAREIIRFIIRESAHIDFTDGGKPKKIFSEDDLEEISQQTYEQMPQSAEAE